MIKFFECKKCGHVQPVEPNVVEDGLKRDFYQLSKSEISIIEFSLKETISRREIIFGTKSAVYSKEFLNLLMRLINKE